MKILSGRELKQGWRVAWSSGLVRAGIGATVAGLILFHVWLLWKSATDQSLLEPIVALKWFAAILLVGALLRLRSTGHLVFRGHRAGVFWLLVLLLHVHLPMAPIAEDVVAAATEVAASGWLWALPATVSLGASFVLAFGLFLFAAGRVDSPAPRRRWRIAVHRRGVAVTGSVLALACRPPPVLA